MLHAVCMGQIIKVLRVGLIIQIIEFACLHT